jgi:hypothetical protein
VDAELRDLRGEGLAEPFERPLGGVVRPDQRERHDPADGRDLQDVPGALRAQDRQGRLRDPQRAEQVGLQLGPNLVLGQLLDEAEVPVAGVVDHDVESAEPVVRSLDGGEVGGAIGDVELQREEPVAVLGGQVVERGGVTRGGSDGVAALQCGDRPLPAEPT